MWLPIAEYLLFCILVPQLSVAEKVKKDKYTA